MRRLDWRTNNDERAYSFSDYLRLSHTFVPVPEGTAVACTMCVCVLRFRFHSDMYRLVYTYTNLCILTCHISYICMCLLMKAFPRIYIQQYVRLALAVDRSPILLERGPGFGNTHTALEALSPRLTAAGLGVQ